MNHFQIMQWIKDQKQEIWNMCKDHPVWAGLAAIGGLVVAKSLCKKLGFFWRYFLRPSKNFKKTYGLKDSWAVITGGSSGIGLAYAHLLAKAGFNLILIARDMKKLQEKQKEISDAYPEVKVEVVSFDFNQPYSKELYESLYFHWEQKDIAILVNNVGVDYACDYYELPEKAISEVLNVNVVSLSFLTHHMILKMKQRPASVRSGIINVSSCFTGSYVPYFNMYTATKAYMNTLMRCLARDLKAQNIDIVTGLTGEALTPRNPMSSIWHDTAPRIAKGQINALGREAETYGTVRHFLYAKYLRSPISWCFRKRLGNTVRLHVLPHLKE